MSAKSKVGESRVRERSVSGAFFVYKHVVSPFLNAGLSGACRFQPSCSEYAAIALRKHGLWRGGWLAMQRLLRCHPGCEGGYDPVPEAVAER